MYGYVLFCVLFFELLFVDRKENVVNSHQKSSVLFCVLLREKFAEVKKMLYLCSALRKEKHY